jgi:hypothetical protein
MPNWLAYGRFFEPWVRWHLASRDGNLTDMRRAIATLREQGGALYTIALETVLAEVEAEEGQLETANATVDRDRVTGGGRPPPVPTERSVRISRTTLFGR